MSWFKRDKKTTPEPINNVDPVTGLTNMVGMALGAREQVLIDSRKLLDRFKILCGFFKHKVLDEILEQSELIYNIFEKNAELNYRKLEQYNYMYTENMIAMISKLKKSREESIIILTEKLSGALKKVSKVETKSIDFKRHANEEKKYAAHISHVLTLAYRELCDPTHDKFTDGHRETTVMAPSYYIERMPDANVFGIPDDVFETLCDYNESDFYYPTLYIIQRRLMGRLNKNVFNITFHYTFKSESNMYLYVFSIKDTSDYFIFVPHKSLFKLVNSTDILPSYIIESNSSWGRMSHELQDMLDKVEKLQLEINKQRSLYEPDVIEVLKKYLDKINDEQLTSNLNEIDADRLFLEELLKLKKFDI